ncbi:amino acid-binding protein [uncultured Pseudoramibacter sp.]|uniref:amino acid-binding protein n=1 Tax=uncultured Pseudoramibacter sp. TaxID=1623493 RepID=UPI0025E4860C|nr:amino acid-binding protein [uncultured Pseudoramibacter sp.]
MTKQLSLFTENKRGALKNITKTLKIADININTMLSNDSAEYGIIRMIVDRPEDALKALTDDGYMCRLDDVIAVNMPDDPGSLNIILNALDEGRINIDYLYISYDRKAATPIAILKTSESETRAFLEGRGFTIADEL